MTNIGLVVTHLCPGGCITEHMLFPSELQLACQLLVNKKNSTSRPSGGIKNRHFLAEQVRGWMLVGIVGGIISQDLPCILFLSLLVIVLLYSGSGQGEG